MIVGISRRSGTAPLSALALFVVLVGSSHGFLQSSSLGGSCRGLWCSSRSRSMMIPRDVRLAVASNDIYAPPTTKDDGDDNSNNDDYSDDEALLREVPKSKLEELCRDLDLPVKGTKEVLLLRLRDYANSMADMERKNQNERKNRVEDGVSGKHPKERYEILKDDNDNDDDNDEDNEDNEEGFFYFSLPADDTSAASVQQQETQNKIKAAQQAEKPKRAAYTTRDSIVAPPPPEDVKPNADGERVVTVYSTTEQNDLTGIAAAQPGQNNMNSDQLFSGSPTGGAIGGSGSENQPWNVEESTKKALANSEELQDAKEKVTECIMTLLATTGAPGFRYDLDDEDVDEDDDAVDDTDTTTITTTKRSSPFGPPPKEFVGFDPKNIPSDLLSPSLSLALRANRGEVLQDVLREFELHAIGQDGMAGDTREKGGGHYHEVQKVRAFLEGFRGAELRKYARETLTVLLDKLVTEGVEGLDLTLASMTRSSDDTQTTEGACELNDSLLSYLSDAIRQQEQRVEEQQLLQKTVERNRQPSPSSIEIEDIDPIDQLWNVTLVDDSSRRTQDPQRIESINPNDPQVKKALQEELQRNNVNAANQWLPKIPDTAPEQLLLLLNLLRERIKAEAAFGFDENGRNLRLLAYCLRLDDYKERKQLILKQMGTSLDRLDSFIELLQSSIEYAESTTHQFLQPSKRTPLNIRLLKEIRKETESIRKQQTYKASSGGGSFLRP